MEAKAEVKAARGDYSRAYLNIVLYAVTGSLVSFAASLIVSFFVDEPPQWLTLLLSFAPMYCVAFPIFGAVVKNQPKSPPVQHKLSLGKWLLCALMAEGISIVGNLIGLIVTSVIGALFSVDTGTDFIEQGVTGPYAWLFMAIAVLCAPAVEETLFRKTLIDRIRKYGDGTAIVLSGLLFGLFHGNFSQFFYAAGMGMLFAFIYVRTGRVRYTIALHMTMNFCGSVLPFLVVKDFDRILEIVMSGDINELLSNFKMLVPLLLYEAFIYGAALAGCILLLVFRKKFTVSPPEVFIPVGERVKAATLNLGFVLLVLFCLIQFVTNALGV